MCMITETDADLLWLDDPPPAVAAWLTTLAADRADIDATVAALAADVQAAAGYVVEGDCDAD